MIPTAILAGLVTGRWCAVALVALAWLTLLLLGGHLSWADVPSAAAFAVVNTAIGVLARSVFRYLARLGH